MTIRIVERREGINADSRMRVAIGDTHCDMATQEIIDFCGQDVVDEIDRKQKASENQRAFVYFEKDGIYYHIFKGLNGTKTLPGKYTYNVYSWYNK